MCDMFEQVENMQLIDEKFEKGSLNDRELALVYEIVENPKRYVKHTLRTHNMLCSQNRRCILCMMDSELVQQKRNP